MALATTMTIFAISFSIFALVANASYLDTYSGTHCDKDTKRYDSCGCNKIDFKQHGGYNFVYTNGQTAVAYSDDDCQKKANVNFNSNDQQCKFFTWKSIYIQCSPPSSSPPPPPPPSPTPSPPPPPSPTPSPPPPPPSPTPSPPPPPPTSTPPPPPPARPPRPPRPTMLDSSKVDIGGVTLPNLPILSPPSPPPPKSSAPPPSPSSAPPPLASSPPLPGPTDIETTDLGDTLGVPLPNLPLLTPPSAPPPSP